MKIQDSDDDISDDMEDDDDEDMSEDMKDINQPDEEDDDELSDSEFDSSDSEAPKKLRGGQRQKAMENSNLAQVDLDKLTKRQRMAYL